MLFCKNLGEIRWRRCAGILKTMPDKLTSSEPASAAATEAPQPGSAARRRGQEGSLSAGKDAALAAPLAVHQPEKIRAAETEALLQKLAPDGVVIIAYGQIIPAKLLPIPKLGWISLHASLLPKYGGAAPINWAIGNGETRTGVTTMRAVAWGLHYVSRADLPRLGRTGV